MFDSNNLEPDTPWELHALRPLLLLFKDFLCRKGFLKVVTVAYKPKPHRIFGVVGMPEEDVMQFLMELPPSGVADIMGQLCRHKEGKCGESKYPCVWCALDG